MTDRVIVEADGGSRGNPGPAAYGTLVRDADTGEVIASRGTSIGTATNNVAEYRGLIAGLELARDRAPGASVEVRMDSQLVIEQMRGNWKIKHPSMRPLAAVAMQLAPEGTTYTWVPRDQNAEADRLVNAALDGETTEPEPAAPTPPSRGWAGGGEATTLVLVRHGVTAATAGKAFSGGLAGANPALIEEGRAQIRATADWLAPLATEVDTVVTSPVRRTRESAEILATRLGCGLVEEPDLAETNFGSWEGLTFAQVGEQSPEELTAWLGDLDHRPGGGESFTAVQKRVLAARDRLVTEYAGKTVVVVSHVTPIKVLVADAVGAPLDALFRMELSPAAVTVLSWFAGRQGERTASMRLFNALPDRTAL